MIKVYDYEGRAHLINEGEISKVVESGVSGKWHGINCYIYLKDKTVIECRDSVQCIEQMLLKET